MSETQKVTAHLPKDLLRRARAATGKGTTETLRQALDLLTAQEASRQLLEMRGKVHLEIDLGELRRDRR